jgi:serine/threonine-protein kinase RsbW
MGTSREPEIVSLRLPSRLELLGVLDRVATLLCERLEFDADVTTLVSMSVIEAGTNAIQHGHKRNPDLPVDVAFRMFADRLEIDVHDTGPGFDPGIVNGDVTSPENLLNARGRGIYIMRSCMDEVDFEFTPSGTVCHLVKRRPPVAAT